MGQLRGMLSFGRNPLQFLAYVCVEAARGGLVGKNLRPASAKTCGRQG
jgi:hypothetical protein